MTRVAKDMVMYLEWLNKYDDCQPSVEVRLGGGRFRLDSFLPLYEAGVGFCRRVAVARGARLLSEEFQLGGMISKIIKEVATLNGCRQIADILAKVSSYQNLSCLESQVYIGMICDILIAELEKVCEFVENGGEYDRVEIYRDVGGQFSFSFVKHDFDRGKLDNDDLILEKSNKVAFRLARLYCWHAQEAGFISEQVDNYFEVNRCFRERGITSYEYDYWDF